MTDDVTTDQRQDGLTRRSVVKTGAHLAWAVPAVSLATAAPALAASGGTVVINPPEDNSVEGETNDGGTKTTAFVDLGTTETPLEPGDLICTVKTSGTIGGNGGNGWTRNPAAGRAGRSEYTFVLTTAVPSGGNIPDLKVNIKGAKKKGGGRKAVPGTSRYFVADGNTGDVLFTGTISG